MADNRSAVKSYLGKVRSTLNCRRSVKKVFLSELRPEVAEFAKGKENLTEEALCAQFGSPEEIAQGFTTRDDYRSLLRRAKKRNVILSVIAGVLTLITAFSIYAAVHLVHHYRNRGYIVIDYTQSKVSMDDFEISMRAEESKLDALEEISRLLEESRLAELTEEVSPETSPVAD